MIRQMLASTLSLAIALSSLAPLSAQTVTRALPIGQTAAPLAVAGARVYSLNLPSMGLSPALTPAGASPALALSPRAVSLPPVQAAPAMVSPAAGVGRHPVLEILDSAARAGVTLPDTLESASDIAKLKAAAESLPPGAARENLMAVADALSAPKGSAGERIGRIFDNDGVRLTEPGAMPSAQAPAATGFWAAASRSRLLPAPLKRYAARKAEEIRPKARPVAQEKFQVAPERLSWSPKDSELPESTLEVPAGDHQIVGQARALQSILFGLKMKGAGYNLIVTGPEGSGRETAVRHILQELASGQATPPDLVSMTNLSDKENPHILRVPAGKGTALEAGVAEFFTAFKTLLPRTLASGQVASLKKQLASQARAQADGLRKAVETEAAALRMGAQGRYGVSVQVRETEEGVQIVVAPTFEGTPMTQELLQKNISEGKITAEEWSSVQAELEEKAGPLVERYQTALIEGQKGLEAAAEQIALLEARAAQMLVSQLGKGLQALAAPAGKADRDGLEAAALIGGMLSQVAADYQAFLPASALSAKGERLRSEDGGPLAADPAEAYQVSLLVSNRAKGGAPVIFERNPSFENLFGSAQRPIRLVPVPGVGMVKTEAPGGPKLSAGSFQRANGGYLVLQAADLVKEQGAWEGLMRALRSGQASIHEGGLAGAMQRSGAYSVPSQVKVVLIGSPSLKMLLTQYDPEFRSQFGASSEFASALAVSAQSIGAYLDFIKRMITLSTGEIMDLTRGAIRSVLEYGAMLSGSHERLSAQFGPIYSLLKEASFWAREEGQEELTEAHIQKALAERSAREGGMIRHMRDLYENNVFHVATDGEVVGQINGLAVMGDFGVPARITVSAAKGAPGVISVDRGAGMTGTSFNKALGIVEGFLKHTFAKAKSFSASVSIAFEQNYGGIDGDSATSTQIYATLSALSGVPIDQGIAVTGSADQFGNVQAIGGANEKITGYFALAKSRGLTGRQGVIIPSSNVADLMLSREIVSAVRAGKFHIWGVDHVSQGIEILTGTAYSEILSKAQGRLDTLR